MLGDGTENKRTLTGLGLESSLGEMRSLSLPPPYSRLIAKEDLKLELLLAWLLVNNTFSSFCGFLGVGEGRYRPKDLVCNNIVPNSYNSRTVYNRSL